MLRISRELMSRGVEARNQLGEILAQIELMKSYTTLQGIPISPGLASDIATLVTLAEPPSEVPRTKRSSFSRLMHPDRLSDDLSWMKPEQVKEGIELALEVHGALSQQVKPATPESIEASTPRKGWARITWPRITDILIATTFFAVAAFALGTALNTQYTNKGFLQLAHLGAALLGACFSQLYTASKYVVQRTFDPASGNSYMTRVVLGAVSGLILANFGSSFIDGNSTLKTLGPGALALIGGYSADAVNMILTRVADMVTAAVQGNGEERLKASEAQITARKAQLEAESKASGLQQRQATVGVLGQILTEATDTTTKERLQALITALGKGSDMAVMDLSNVRMPIITPPPVSEPAGGGGPIKTDPKVDAPPAGNGKPLNAGGPQLQATDTGAPKLR